MKQILLYIGGKMDANIVIENSITKNTVDIPCKIISLDYSDFH